MRGSITKYEERGGKEGQSQRTRELAAYEGLLSVSPLVPLPLPRPFFGEKNSRRCAHLSNSCAYARVSRLYP